MIPPQPPPSILLQGEMELEGLLPWGSNYTFLAHICRDEEMVPVVYKPRQGERPLWDFARGTLCQRETAAYVVDAILEWHIVPPTVMRDGPHGEGSVQLYVAHEPDQHYFTFEGRFVDQTQRICAFDLLINNADRKSGHVLLGDDDHLWAIDHGVCFHAEHKLRTVIWEFAGQPLPTAVLADLARLDQWLTDSEPHPLRQQLQALLTGREVEAMHQRLRLLRQRAIFPRPGPGRHYPWPPV